MSADDREREQSGAPADVRSLEPIRRVRGRVRVPGDKSISHRALLFGAIAEGDTRVRGVAPGADVLTTRRLVEALGAEVRTEGDELVVRGRGWRGLDREAGASVLDLDCGNSGTTVRLALGILAGRTGRFVLSGDRSLSRRPMARVVDPLRSLGARIEGGDRLPLDVRGGSLQAAQLETGVASAQVKSALLLATLQAQGTSTVREPRQTRDHTERMLRAMGAGIEPLECEGGWRIQGGAPSLRPLSLAVPGDPSSAAYLLGLACVLEDSEVAVEGVSMNTTRLGFCRLLRKMGGNVQCEEMSEAPLAEEPEPSGRLVARSSTLRPVGLTEDEVTDAIDEIPLIASLAATIDGETVIRGAGELRRKESDRIATTTAMLHAFGAEVEELEDGWVVRGPSRLRGARVDSGGDHRIAMCAAVLAALAEGPTQLSGASWVRISYPDFFEDLARISG
jgi:3-phosphoshikimate 1-carboxyvinyltransferase